VPSLSQYMAQYDHEHTNPWNKVMHAIGIPFIIAGIILLWITWWRIGLALFVGGWILLFAGHRRKQTRILSRRHLLPRRAHMDSQGIEGCALWSVAPIKRYSLAVRRKLTNRSTASA
jgi:Protein of unknown function (DUF962)